MATENGTYIWDVDREEYVNIGNTIGSPGKDGAPGKDGSVRFEDLTPEQIEEIRGPRGFSGEKGEPGESIIGPKGDPFTYEDFTPEQLESLKGPKGDKMQFSDLTIEEKREIKGDPGERGLQGIPGNDGRGIDRLELNADFETYQQYKLYFTDGSFQFINLQKGKNGVDGINGTNGKDGKDSTVPGPPGPSGSVIYPIFAIMTRYKYMPDEIIYDPQLRTAEAGDSYDKTVRTGDFIITTGYSMRFPETYHEDLTKAGDLLVCIKGGEMVGDAEFNWVTKIEGSPGPIGPEGPASTVPGPAGKSATIRVGSVTTGAAGSSASVTNSGTSTDAVLNFTIPRGATGSAGPGFSTGGTKGQILTKKSASNYDTEWVNHTEVFEDTFSSSTIKAFHFTSNNSIEPKSVEVFLKWDEIPRGYTANYISVGSWVSIGGCPLGGNVNMGFSWYKSNMNLTVSLYRGNGLDAHIIPTGSGGSVTIFTWGTKEADFIPIPATAGKYLHIRVVAHY